MSTSKAEMFGLELLKSNLIWGKYTLPDSQIGLHHSTLLGMCLPSLHPTGDVSANHLRGKILGHKTGFAGQTITTTTTTKNISRHWFAEVVFALRGAALTRIIVQKEQSRSRMPLNSCF